jgi:hypothetical protein
VSESPDFLPRRYQRKRNVSGNIPVDAKYVGRPGRYGNPYRIGAPHPDDDRPMTREDVVELFRRDLDEGLGYGSGTIDWGTVERLAELRGHDVVCWCALDELCHGDVWLEYANRIREPRRSEYPVCI